MVIVALLVDVLFGARREGEEKDLEEEFEEAESAMGDFCVFLALWCVVFSRGPWPDPLRRGSFGDSSLLFSGRLMALRLLTLIIGLDFRVGRGMGMLLLTAG